jgi:hypothetical protein
MARTRRGVAMSETAFSSAPLPWTGMDARFLADLPLPICGAEPAPIGWPPEGETRP